MAETKTLDWKNALKSKEAFHDFIVNYFAHHEELTGDYSNSAYFEYYRVSLDSKDGLVIKFTEGNNFSVNSAIPFTDKEKISIEQFRQLILNKKFADKGMSLADVFELVAQSPEVLRS